MAEEIVDFEATWRAEISSYFLSIADSAWEMRSENRSVPQEPRSNQGPKVLLLDFLLTYYLRTTNLMFLVEVKGN